MGGRRQKALEQEGEDSLFGKVCFLVYLLASFLLLCFSVIFYAGSLLRPSPPPPTPLPTPPPPPPLPPFPLPLRDTPLPSLPPPPPRPLLRYYPKVRLRSPSDYRWGEEDEDEDLWFFDLWVHAIK